MSTNAKKEFRVDKTRWQRKFGDEMLLRTWQVEVRARKPRSSTAARYFRWETCQLILA